MRMDRRDDSSKNARRGQNALTIRLKLAGQTAEFELDIATLGIE